MLFGWDEGISFDGVTPLPFDGVTATGIEAKGQTCDGLPTTHGYPRLPTVGKILPTHNHRSIDCGFG